MWTIFLLIFLTFLIGVGAWLIFLWSVKSGQYDDPEGPKYRMLEDEDEKTIKRPPVDRTKENNKK